MMTPAQPKRKHPLFITFSGIDGAGKSTQIQSFAVRLQDSGRRVRVFQFWNDVATLRRLRESGARTLFKGDSGVGSPLAPVNRRDKNVQSWPMTIVRLCTYFADAVSMSVFVKRALRSEVDVLIFDRYIYDELANLNLRNPLLRAYARLTAAIVPVPDIAFILDAEPAEARARKPEYPLEFLHTSRHSYLALGNLIGGMTVIPPMPEPKVTREILKIAGKTVPLDAAPSNTSGIAPLAHSSDIDAMVL